MDMGPVVKSRKGKNELIVKVSWNATFDPLDSDNVISSSGLHGFGSHVTSIRRLFSIGVNGNSIG